MSAPRKCPRCGYVARIQTFAGHVWLVCLNGCPAEEIDAYGD